MASRPVSSAQARDQPETKTAAPKLITFDRFEKMNTKPARQNLSEHEAGWMENLQPVEANDLKVVPAALAAISTVSGKVVTRMFPAAFSGIDYMIFFATDGSCTAVNLATGAQTTVAPASTFSSTPDMTIFGSSRILIIDTTAAGYSTWDGTLFVESGGVSPNIQVTAGGTYSATPAVTITGGSGSGATAHAVMGGSGASQFVASVVLDNPGSGYKPGDVLTVNFTLGGGATATARIWPQTSGTTIAVFGGRVWWANGRVLNFTGTQGYDDTSTANAAGSLTINDADLVHSITGLRSLNNYLYIFGDQSIKQIGNITVSSSVTLFTVLTLASDIGTTFLMTIQSYNRLVLFANKNGVYGIFGASVQKVSDDLDGIFQAIDFTQPLSSGLHDLHTSISGVSSGGSLHNYVLLVKYNDPVAGPRPIMCAFQTNKWFVMSQGALLAICNFPRASSTQWELYGSSGADVTQLFQNSNAPVAITLKTALTAHGNLVLGKQVIKAGIAVTAQTAQNFNMLIETENGSNLYPLAAASVVNWVNNANQQINWLNNTPAIVVFIGGGFRFPYTSADGYGKVLGATITGMAQNFAINAVVIEYVEKDLWGDLP
jgi:hypothetical protein